MLETSSGGSLQLQGTDEFYRPVLALMCTSEQLPATLGGGVTLSCSTLTASEAFLSVVCPGAAGAFTLCRGRGMCTVTLSAQR